VWLLDVGTQQSEDPREVWQGGKHNMIKQYMELTQNDLKVSCYIINQSTKY